MRILAWILIIIAIWMLPMTTFAFLMRRVSTAPVIFVPVQMEEKPLIWMV
jgi:hypothetical protein